MVIVNPKLSLPVDLPYKKRQRPFNPNTSLHQATIRYNEALRKQYNDIQFAKRYENGAISQNELTSVNTIDIGKNVDSQLFSEMSDLNPLLNEQVAPHATRKRKSKKIFICSGSSISDAITPGSSSCDHTSSSGPVSPSSGGVTSQNEDGAGMQASNPNASYDCNNTEMFPQLQATIPNATTDNDRVYFSRSNANRQLQHQQPPPSPNSSLEAQAINEYEPTADSAHDMIFGNVMGLHYGNYIHDHLWTPANQQQQNQNHHMQNNPHMSNDPANCQFSMNMSPQTFESSNDYQPVSLTPPTHTHHPQLHICGGNKAVGFNLPTTSGSGLGNACQNQQNTYPNMNYISNGTGIMLANASNSATTVGNQMPIPIPGNCYTHVQSANSTRPNSRSRSTSVPRPRVGGARKETLKQAAIRCGIIKGNQTVPVIPKRSLCLVPLQLSAAQSDPAVSVVEILHPRTLIPTCSSEALVEENYGYNKFKMNLNQSHPGDNYAPFNNNNIANNNIANENETLGSPVSSTKENISDEGRLLTQISSISDFRMLEGAMSCASF